MQPWVKRFQWIITREKLEITKCENDACLYVKHDRNGKLTLWAATYINDVVYGGLESETIYLKKQVTEQIAIAEIGILDVHQGVHRLLKAKEYKP